VLYTDNKIFLEISTDTLSPFRIVFHWINISHIHYSNLLNDEVPSKLTMAKRISWFFNFITKYNVTNVTIPTYYMTIQYMIQSFSIIYISHTCYRYLLGCNLYRFNYHTETLNSNHHFPKWKLLHQSNSNNNIILYFIYLLDVWPFQFYWHFRS